MKQLTRRRFLALDAGVAVALGSNKLTPTRAADIVADYTKPGPIASIPLEDKIGQMLLVGFRGNYLDNANPIVDAISQLHLRSMILFDNPDLPATLSYKTITGLLREQLRFDGVVMTDDMQMRAITDYYTFEQAVVLAVKAGVDIITVGSNLLYGPDTVFRAISAIRGLVERGEIPTERIDQSYSRIMRPQVLI